MRASRKDREGGAQEEGILGERHDVKETPREASRHHPTPLHRKLG